jgi:HEAT repeat protein
MRKRAQIAVAVLFVALMGMSVRWVLRPQRVQPVYQGKELEFWLREYSGWDTTPKDWAQAKLRAENATRHIGTNAIPTLLEMLRKTESPRTYHVIDFWDRRVANARFLPVWVRHPAWYKRLARYQNMYGEIGFKILGPDAREALPDLIAIYELNLSSNSLAADSRPAIQRALIDIGPPAIPYFLKWAAGTNECERLTAAQALSEIPAPPSVIVPPLIDFLSHTNSQVRLQAAERLGKCGPEGRQAVPDLVRLLCDPNGRVRSVAANALRNIDHEAAVRAGVK